MPKLTVAIPTYQRPSELESFIKKHHNELAKREILLAIFHNERNPLYSPENSKYLKAYFNTQNIGITGNAKRMCEHFQNPNEYWLPLSDQDTINMQAIDQLLHIISEEDFDCLKFDKGESYEITRLKCTYHSSYLDWLRKVPISEVQFVYRGQALSSLISRRSRTQGGAMWDSIPTHTLVLIKACKEGFIGVDTNLKIVHNDVLGSVSSGWTHWAPNVITCHVMFMKYLMYAAASMTNKTLSIDNEGLIKGFLPGLINHMYISIHQKMYSGRRLGKLAGNIIRQNKHIISNLDSSLLEEYDRINNYSLIDLPQTWQKQFYLMEKQMEIFAKTYPSWIHQ